jgi:hypothetical protein
MQIELRPLASIIPYANNPRLNDPAVDAVAASIKEFGFRRPLVVDDDGVIIVGHTRYKAAQKLGLQIVPVHVAKGLSPAQIKAYRLADNQTARLSDWDNDKLPLELAALQELGFDLNLTGFSGDELLRLLESPAADGLCDPDAVPEPPDEATTRPGDFWVLGEHRLLCGDSAKPEDVDRLLDGAPIHVVNTDLVECHPTRGHAGADRWHTDGRGDCRGVRDAVQRSGGHLGWVQGNGGRSVARGLAERCAGSSASGKAAVVGWACEETPGRRNPEKLCPKRLRCSRARGNCVTAPEHRDRRGAGHTNPRPQGAPHGSQEDQAHRHAGAGQRPAGVPRPPRQGPARPGRRGPAGDAAGGPQA